MNLNHFRLNTSNSDLPRVVAKIDIIVAHGFLRLVKHSMCYFNLAFIRTWMFLAESDYIVWWVDDHDCCVPQRYPNSETSPRFLRPTSDIRHVPIEKYIKNNSFVSWPQILVNEFTGCCEGRSKIHEFSPGLYCTMIHGFHSTFNTVPFVHRRNKIFLMGILGHWVQ